MTSHDALPSEAIDIRKGDRVGYRLNGQYQSAIVLAVCADGLSVNDGLYYGVFLRWDKVLPGF